MNTMNDMNNGTQDTGPLSHEAVRQALETLFVDEDGDEAFRDVPAWQVQRHLADCASCRRHFDAHALADRFLTSEDRTEPASFEQSFGEASFMGALDNMLEEERAAAETDSPDEENLIDLSSERSERQARQDEQDEQDKQNRRANRARLRSFGLAAAVLLIGGASWFAFDQSQKTNLSGSAQDDPFQARSAAATDSFGPFDEPEIEIFCAERTPDGVEFTGTKDAPFGLLGCPLDAEIKLAYKNSSPKLHYAAFFGVDQQGKIYWYGPTPADAAAVEVDQSSEMLPFGESIRLEVNHEPGHIRVFGLFSTEPVDFVTLDQAVDDLDRRRLFDGEEQDRLGARGVLSRGVLSRGVLTSNTFEATAARDPDARETDARHTDDQSSDGGTQ